jgi:hypothetical protein
VLDLEASGEVVCAGLGLMLAAIGRPVHRGVNNMFGLVTDVEQAPDFGEGQADPTTEWRGLFGSGGTGDPVAGGGAGFCRTVIGFGSPFFA